MRSRNSALALMVAASLSAQAVGNTLASHPVVIAIHHGDCLEAVKLIKERAKANGVQEKPGIGAVPVQNGTAVEAPRPTRKPRERESHFASKPGSESAIREAKADVLP